MDKDQEWLYPGTLLRTTQKAVGMGKEVLDISILPEGKLLRYIGPAWLLCETDDGDKVEIRVESLKRVEA